MLKVFDADSAMDKGRTALIYGKSGMGKTTLASFLPACLFIDVENRTGPWRERVYELGGAVAQISEIADIVQLCAMMGNPEAIQKEIGFVPRSLVIDSITDLVDTNINQLESSSKVKNRAGEVDGWAVYRYNLTDIRKTLVMLKGLGITVLITALEKYDSDETGQQLFMPDVPGQLERKLPAAFDITARIHPQPKGNDTLRVITTVPSRQFSAKAPEGVPAVIDLGRVGDDVSGGQVREALNKLGLLTE